MKDELQLHPLKERFVAMLLAMELDWSLPADPPIDPNNNAIDWDSLFDNSC